MKSIIVALAAVTASSAFAQTSHIEQLPPTTVAPAPATVQQTPPRVQPAPTTIVPVVVVPVRAIQPMRPQRTRSNRAPGFQLLLSGGSEYGWWKGGQIGLTFALGGRGSYFAFGPRFSRGANVERSSQRQMMPSFEIGYRFMRRRARGLSGTFLAMVGGGYIFNEGYHSSSEYVTSYGRIGAGFMLGAARRFAIGVEVAATVGAAFAMDSNSGEESGSSERLFASGSASLVLAL